MTICLERLGAWLALGRWRKPAKIKQESHRERSD